MKIIILEHEPFHERKKEHYFINQFIEKGFTIQYWGLHKALPYAKSVSYTYEESENYVKYFDRLPDLFDQLEKLDPLRDVLIVELMRGSSSRSIFEFIDKKKFKWVAIDYYINPVSWFKTGITKKEMIKFLVLKGNIISEIFKRIVHRISKPEIRQPNILFHTGSDLKYLPPAQQYVSLDYFDVITYNNLHEQRFLTSKYVVFLDMMLVNHPDIARAGYHHVLDSNEYYNSLNKIFDIIETELQMQVVIASHPKADYKNEFGNRLIVKNKTAELVVNSEMVLSHGSLSVSFALLAKKKIVYINLKKLFSKTIFLRSLQESLYKAASSLDAVVIDEDSRAEDIHKPVNYPVYEEYLNNFFRKDSKKSDDDNFNIMLSSLLKLINEN